MKNYWLAAIPFLMLASCGKLPDGLEFEKDFCDNVPTLNVDNAIELPHFVQAFDTSSSTLGLFIAPTAFTPDGDGTNDSFAIMFSYQEDNEPVSTYEYLNIYDKHKLIKEITSGRMKWDGKNKKGKIVAGTYGYEAAIRLPNDRIVTATGNFMLIPNGIVKEKYMDCLRFGDQIHPRLGFVYSTQEKLESK